MSLSTSGQGSRPPTVWEDNPPPYTQRPLVEGSYGDDEEDVLTSPHNSNRADCSDSIEGGFTNPAYQNPPQSPQYAPCPQNPADLHQLQPNQQSSQYIAPYQPHYGTYCLPPKYTEHDANATLRDGPPPPYAMGATGQQPAYDSRSVVLTYPPPATGQWVVAQPRGFGGQPPTIVVQPILEDPPKDYMAYSIFVSLCCFWFIGFVAISKSIKCRKAIAAGNRELANENSNGARNTAHASLALGLWMYVVVGVMVGFSMASIL